MREDRIAAWSGELKGGRVQGGTRESDARRDARPPPEAEPESLFSGWSLELDALLVRYIDAQLQQGSGSVLSLRPAQVATLTGDDEAYRPLAGVASKTRVLRTALLQRFNSLLIKLLPLVHTLVYLEVAVEAGRGQTETAAAPTGGGRSAELA